MPVETHLYAGHGGLRRAGDLYRPAGPGPHPAVIAVPGGGWLRGTRTSMAQWGEYLSARGFALFAIDYQQSTDGPAWPANLGDVVAGIAWLRDHAASVDIDADRIGILAASAGAHLAALAVLGGDAPGIAVLVLAYGVYDPRAHWLADQRQPAGPDGDLTERMTGCRPDDDGDLYDAVSPLGLVKPASAGALDVLLVWGDADEVVLPVQSQSFAAALTAAGAAVATEIVAGAGHFWFSKDRIADPAGHSAAVAPKVAHFLEQRLKRS